MRRQLGQALLAALTAAMIVSACGGQPSPTSPSAPMVSSAGSARSTTETLRFTHPTEITNPFYPVSSIGQSISLGTKGGQSYRSEVTVLPDSRSITWDGQQTEVRVSQSVVYAGGKLVEVGYDYFAQADDGSVYLLGEDVTHYRDGKAVDQKGSWLAGKDDAAPALMMPAHPQIGQVFNSQNLPGVMVETGEVVSLNEKATTPAGPIADALLIKETAIDGEIEYRVYAANYGIVESRANNGQVNLVWLNRTDAKPQTVPDPLSTIEAQAEDMMDVVPRDRWERVTADLADITQAWQAYQKQATIDHVPQPFQAAFTAALDRLHKAVTDQEAAGTLQAANDLSAAVFDLFTVYRPATPADLGRLDVLERQIVLDTVAKDFPAAANSLAITRSIWARLKPDILAQRGSAAATRFENSLAMQQTALGTRDASALTAEASDALELVDKLEQLY